MFSKILLIMSLAFFPFHLVHADPITNYVGKKVIDASATIDNGATTSGAIDVGGMSLVGIKFPAAFTGTTVTFTMCDTLGGTYVPVYNASGAVSYTIAQARYYAIAPADFSGIRYLKIVSGSAEGAARTLVLSLKGVN